MKILLLYVSPGKTTEKISRALADRLTQEGHQVTLLNIGKAGRRNLQEAGNDIFDGIDLLGIGSPVFHMRVLPPMENYLREALPNIGMQTKAFIYLTYGGITTGKAFLNTSAELEKYHIPIVGAFKVWAPHFFNKAQYPDPQALQTVEEFCTHLTAKAFSSIPWSRIRQLFSYQTRKVRLIYPLTEFIGRLRELPIQFDESKCKLCKRCYNECPVGAISMHPFPVHEPKKCIYCYHCTTVCSQNAVLCPTEKVEQALRVNKKVIGEEQPRNAVYF